jgi:molybdenum cofactor biosynthesis enzyme
MIKRVCLEELLDEEQQLTEEEVVVDIMLEEEEVGMEDMVEVQGLVVVLEAVLGAVQGLLPIWEFLFPPD